MSIEKNKQAKIARLNNKIKTLKATVQQAQEAYRKNPTKELKLAMCMANLDLANANAELWLLTNNAQQEKETVEQGSEFGE